MCKECTYAYMIVTHTRTNTNGCVLYGKISSCSCSLGLEMVNRIGCMGAGPQWDWQPSNRRLVQSWSLFEALKKRTWPDPSTVVRKLHGSLEDLWLKAVLNRRPLSSQGLECPFDERAVCREWNVPLTRTDSDVWLWFHPPSRLTGNVLSHRENFRRFTNDCGLWEPEVIDKCLVFAS